MTCQRWMLAFCFSLTSVFGTGESATTVTPKYTCRTFGSGVVQPFNGSHYYVRSNCPFTLTRFTYNRVECDITTRRGDNGLLVQVEIIINKVQTVLQNGSITVEKKSVSLPYKHTFQHIFHYGIYTRLRSALLPLSVTWHNVPGGIDTMWVELEQELSPDMTGLCGKDIMAGSVQQLITDSMLPDITCKTKDPESAVNTKCRLFFSYTLDCLRSDTNFYIQVCEENIYGYEESTYVSCAFFKEVALQCGETSYVWNEWRHTTGCAEPTCLGDLVYLERGDPFVPSCSNLNPSVSSEELISTCVCRNGNVLNDHADDYRCVSASSCPCVYAGQIYQSGDIRSTKCQSCMCQSGQWQCSENSCHSKCIIEGQCVTTYDGKEYVVPGKCTYVASQGPGWIILIEYSKDVPRLNKVVLLLQQEMYIFTHNMVTFNRQQITELHQSAQSLAFWQSSMYVHVHTTFGLKIQVQVYPEIQLYITPPGITTGTITGLCGNSNSDTTDDFTTSSGMIENSAKPFALSWSSDSCTADIPTYCINTENEIFADEKCSVLNDPTGIFSKCHGYIPTDHYHTVCIQKTCNCGSKLQQCLCAALGSYAKACASLGVVIGDWRKATNCTLQCQKNQEFSYNTEACNHTCRSLSGPDPRCGLDDEPVEGCGCPEGTHLNQGNVCTPKSECPCYYNDGTTPPGTAVIDGRQCICENGELQCSADCGCQNGKVCVHCSKYPVNTAQKTCDSLSKPMGGQQGANMTCKSGCYCPHDQYEDHRGNCVSLDNCTCVYSGKVFSAGQRVKTNCRNCICRKGEWRCKEEPCPGKCQVYGNGHYQTFDSKRYRFDGQCQYTLVQDGCGYKNSTFSVRVESVPCCDEALTCSRSIILDLQGEVTLKLSDMKVTRRHHAGWTLQKDSLYTTHTVGLYTIISVPSKGITLIWDKHTRITIELHESWRNRVCGLCGNFDSNEMNDLQISGSAVVSSPLAFGNSWKTATPPCSDVTTEIFPCERHSYCSAWAQRRCMIITGDTFKDCHFKVDPDPYYHACMQESCSCEFEGKFLGFCTAVAAYAEACSEQNVCINWRTPDLCPVYCDYYNEQGQCRWHYEACGKMLICGDENYISHKLEGCYPRCPMEAPYFDENTGECTSLRNCTCYFNDTIIQPRSVVIIQGTECCCENGTMKCSPPPTTTPATTLTKTTTAKTEYSTTAIPTTETSSTTGPTSSPTMTAITNGSTTTDNWSTIPSTTSISTPVTYIKTASTYPSVPPTTQEIVKATNATTDYFSTSLTTNDSSYTTSFTSAETSPTMAPTSSSPMTTITTDSTVKWSTVQYNTSTPTTATTSTYTVTSVPSTEVTNTTGSVSTESTVMTTAVCECVDMQTKKHWDCGAMWTEDCFHNYCDDGTIELTPVVCQEPPIPQCPGNQYTKVPDGCCYSYKCNLCECVDLKMDTRWECGEMWTEDCFHKHCNNGTIELTSVVCQEPTIPNCPRNQFTKVSDGCCSSYECDCRCDLFGDPHYISFQGVAFDFLEPCTYILVEEQSPRHHLTIAVDTFYCAPGLDGSCTKGVIVEYQNNTATLSILTETFEIQATLNNMTIEPPYMQHGMRFETTGYIVSIHLPEIRSYVSLSLSYTLVVSLAMEYFANNTQGQCGVCGGGSCIRSGGQIEDDSCCSKTAYDWVYADPQKPACDSAPRDIPCFETSTVIPTITPSTPCPESRLCELLNHPIFSNCSFYVNLDNQKKACQFDSCRNGPCSTLEHAAEECKAAGFCFNWRELTNGSCNVTCPDGLIYRECQERLDDVCYAGTRFRGAPLKDNKAGCYCPKGLVRAGNHSNVCVPSCNYCKGPLGEPRWPGEVWESGCNLCTCNNQTHKEVCVPKPPPPIPLCSNNSVLVSTSCCGDQTCVEKTCSHYRRTYKVGERWKDAAHPCMSFSCSIEGIQTETKVCPMQDCQEEDRMWDDEHCCFTCNKSCAPKMTTMNVTVENCVAVMQIPVCQGFCASHHRVMLNRDLQVEQKCSCCQERTSDRRPVTLQCRDQSTKTYDYQHITSCECSACSILGQYGR